MSTATPASSPAAQAGVSAAVTTEQLAEVLFDLGTYLFKSSQCDVLEAIAELDLSMSQIRLLFVVDSQPRDPALHEVAAMLRLSLAATGRAADSLVRTGLIGRYEDSDDRRVKRITLTGAGLEIVERLMATRMEHMRRFATALTPAERTRLFGALDPILTRPEFRAVTNGPNS